MQLMLIILFNYSFLKTSKQEQQKKNSFLPSNIEIVMLKKKQKHKL